MSDSTRKKTTLGDTRKIGDDALTRKTAAGPVRAAVPVETVHLAADIMPPGWRVEEQLPAGGAEADLYLVSKDRETHLVKWYRKGVKVKESVLAEMKKISERFPEHVVKIHDFGYSSESGRYYERMEYIENGNLRQFVPWGYVSKSLFERVYEELRSAITTLHENGIVHRDLKPENILVRSRQPLDLVFADFGMSSAIDRSMSAKMTGTVGGTLEYMAPECFAAVDGQVVAGKESDLWALGIIFYEMLLGHPPFQGISPAMVGHTIITQGVHVDEDAATSELKSFVPIVQSLLEKDPMNRRFSESGLGKDGPFKKAKTAVMKEYTKVVVLEGHTKEVWGALLRPDGSILSWSNDNTLCIWSPEGNRLWVLEGHTESVWGALLRPSGSILSWSEDATLRIWSPEGNCLRVLEGHIEDVRGALLRPDGPILSWANDNTLRIWS